MTNLKKSRNEQNNLMPKREQKQYLNVRIRPSHRAALVSIAIQEDKTLTQIVEDAVEVYLHARGR